MKAKKQKLYLNNSGLAISTAVILVILFAWHFLDVTDSVRECGDTFLMNGYLNLGMFSAVICAAVFHLMFVKKASLRFAVCFAVLLLGFANIFVFKGLSAPDEISHYISAYKISNVMMFQEPTDAYGRVNVRACDMFLEDMEDRIDEVNGDEDDPQLRIFGQTLDEQVYRIYAGAENIAWKAQDEIEVSCQWTVNTTPFAYFPQAIGITAARILHAGPLGLITAGKLCNLLFFTAVLYFALGLLAEGSVILAGVSLLPMTIHLAGSMSYDVFVMAMSFLFIALVMDIHKKGAETGKCELAGAAVVLALLGPCKLVYSLLILLVLILFDISKEKLSVMPVKQVMAFGLICCVLLAISMYLVNSRTIENYAAADERIITWAEEPQGYTLTYLIHRPIETARLVYRSFMVMTGNWFSTMFGLYLGNQDPVYNVPYPVIGAMALGLFLLAAGSELRLSIMNKIICAGVFMLVLGALMGSMLLAYTPMSSPYIEGVQGRYLLPVLPLALMCIPGEWISLKRPLDRELLWTFAALDVYILFRVYATVCLRL